MAWLKFRYFLVFLFFFLTPFLVVAEEQRFYFYESINQKFVVNTDTTVDVEEEQIYNFNGEYHKGWRSIPFNKVSDITDIVVLDGQTKKPLMYVPRTLDKNDPNSWGKYTYFRRNGNLEIEWYYNAKDELKSWILKYKLIGSLSFLNDKDELYWNLFTNYDVPVDFVSATVVIPENNFNLESLSFYLYRTNVGLDGSAGRSSLVDNKTFKFETEAVSPREAVTIAVGWPKGLIERGAFWGQWLKAHYVSIYSILIILLTVFVIFIYWLKTEKIGKNNRTIIPQYEPPAGFGPEMVDFILNESVTPKTWSAVVVDLAYRGYLKIEECGKSYTFFQKTVIVVIYFFVVGIACFAFVGVFLADYFSFSEFIFSILLLLFVFKLLKIIARSFSSKDYIVSKNREYENDISLKKYEKTLLDILVGSLTGGNFDTKRLRTNKTISRSVYESMVDLREEFLESAQKETEAFDKSVYKKDYFWIFTFVTVFVSFFVSGILIMLRSSLLVGPIAETFSIGSLVIFVIALVGFIVFSLFKKYQPVLNEKGLALKEHLLGFKLYLETAEKYRMERQTSQDLFEKYLSYAIAFGVEEKWGKAFEGLSMIKPNWYNSVHTGTFNSASVSPSFSASAFSASFASSFSSAFSSSSGSGGGSGGGGGAGGGGGGGGGGAS